MSYLYIKRITAALLTAFTVLSFSACNDVSDNGKSEDADTVSYEISKAGEVSKESRIESSTASSQTSSKTESSKTDTKEGKADFENISYWAKKDKDIKITAKASVENSELKYAFYFKRASNKKWNPIGEEYSGRRTASFTAKDDVDYQVKVVIRDKDKNTVGKVFKIDSKFSVLENRSKIGKTEVKKGGSLKIAARGEGGTEPYTYAYYFKHKDNERWVKIGTEFTENNSAKFKPTSADDYQLRVVVKDNNGQAAVKKFDVKVV